MFLYLFLFRKVSKEEINMAATFSPFLTSTSKIKSSTEAVLCESISKKHKFMMQKPYTKSLSTHKLVYAREEDAENTFIIRSFGEINEQFGLKGVDVIRDVFCAVLKLLCEDEKVVVSKTKFVEKGDLEKIFEFPRKIAENYEHLNVCELRRKMVIEYFMLTFL